MKEEHLCDHPYVIRYAHTMAKIGVFPAAGGLGTSIINHLVKLVPASELILIARKPDNLAELTRAGATVRRADYEDPATLERAFDGIGILMLISYASFEIQFRFEVGCSDIPSGHIAGVMLIRGRHIRMPLTLPAAAVSSTSSIRLSPLQAI